MAKSIVRRFVAIFSSNATGILVALLATPIIVRILGTQAYGEYAFMLSVLSIGLLFSNAGIFDGVRKYIKEADRGEQWPDRVIGFYGRLGFGLAVLAIVGTLLLVELGFVRRTVGEQFELYFVLVAITILTQQVFSIGRSALMGFDREDISEKLLIANRLLAVGGGLGLIWFGYGVAGLLAAKLVANAITGLVGIAAVGRFADLTQLFRTAPADFPRRRMLEFNVLSIALFGLFVSIKHVDIILIQGIHGSTETAYYKAALNLAEFVWFVPRIVQTTLLHSTSELWSEDRHEAITAISSRVTRYSLLFTLLLIIGLGALAEPTVSVYYGSAYEPAVLPLLILLPGAMGFAVARPILAIGQGKGAFRYLIAATGAAAVVNLVLNLLLIPPYGIAGAAVATSIGYFSMLVFHVAGARAIGFDPIDDLRLPKVTTTGVVGAAAILGLATVVDSLPWSLVVVPPAGFVIFSIVAVMAGAVSRDELRELREHVPV